MEEPGPKNTILCRYFARGNCSRGDSCHFLHAVSNMEKHTLPPPSRVVVVENEPVDNTPAVAPSRDTRKSSDNRDRNRRDRDDRERRPPRQFQQNDTHHQADKVVVEEKPREQKAPSKESTAVYVPPKSTPLPEQKVPETLVDEEDSRPQREKKNNRDRKRNERPQKLVKVNTETFEPSYAPPDMRIILATPKKQYTPRDVIIAPNLFCEESDFTIYHSLLQEMKSTHIPENDLWKLWHGDTHLIADDHVAWKTSCPTFTRIVEQIGEYFHMDIKATRFNWYRDASEWKPYHFDAAAVDAKKAKTQNMTIGISFGSTRDIAFEHGSTKTRVAIPLPNGLTYGFSSKVNIDWRHGIPQLVPGGQKKQQEEEEEGVQLDAIPEGRVSIIAWGYCKLIDT